jgi:sugar lactone lactonase YvrE
VALDPEGNLFVADSANWRVRKVDRNGIITTVAGNGNITYSGDHGPATSAGMGPAGIALDAAGNLYIADLNNSRVRKVDLNGIITTVAGTGRAGSAGDGGPATLAHLSEPQGVTLDVAGNLYIADQGNGNVRKVDSRGIISTFAGGGTQLGDGGPATEASIIPVAVAADATGNVYIADAIDGRVRKVDANGIITTIAGNGKTGFSGDGGPATQANLNGPVGVAVDAAGNLYIADRDNFRIRRIDKTGTIRTIAGNGKGAFSGDGGPATKAGIYPWGVAVGSPGILWLTDQLNYRVRKVDVSQSAVDFASQSVGTVSPSQEVFVTSTGNQHIEFTGLSLTGDFGQLTGTNRDCTDTTFLGAGFSCALRITFAPTAAGSLTGSATVTDNSLSLPGTKQTISLSGTGTNP